MGTIVKKRFERKFYFGKVVDYDVKEGRYKILYDDGDKEDFDEEDMLRYIVVSSSTATKKPTAKKASTKKISGRPRGRPKKK